MHAFGLKQSPKAFTLPSSAIGESDHEAQCCAQFDVPLHASSFERGISFFRFRHLGIRLRVGKAPVAPGAMISSCRCGTFSTAPR